MNEEEKIENSIFLHQQKINELEKFIERINESETQKIRIKIETKHWYGYSEPFLIKLKHRFNISKETMIDILNKMIDENKETINKLIDMEIDRRIK